MLERSKLEQINHEALFRSRQLKQPHAPLPRIQRRSFSVHADHRVPGDGSQSLLQGSLGLYDCERRPAHIAINSTLSVSACFYSVRLKSARVGIGRMLEKVTGAR